MYSCFITTKKRYLRNIPTSFYFKKTSVFAVVANERPWVRHTTCCAMPSAVISFASSRAACYSTSNSSDLHATASAFPRSFTFRAFKVASLFWTAIAGAPRWPLMEYTISLLALISVISWFTVALDYLAIFPIPRISFTFISIPNSTTFQWSPSLCFNSFPTRTFRPLRPFCEFTVLSVAPSSVELVFTHALTFDITGWWNRTTGIAITWPAFRWSECRTGVCKNSISKTINRFWSCFSYDTPIISLSKIEKVPRRGIRREKSSKDMPSSRNLVSTIWAQASPQ